MKKFFRTIVFLYVLTSGFMLLAQTNDLEITTRNNSDNSVDFSFSKSTPGSYYVELRFTETSNCNVSDFRGVAKGFNGTLLTLRPINPDRGIGYSYSFRYMLGVPKPKIDPDFCYVLPFKKGKKVRILETHDISSKYFNKAKESTWKSFLVESNVADTICAMRKGTVVNIDAEYDEQPSDNYNFTSKLNSITIEHKDGTFSKYKGFNKNLIFVKLGQKVYPHTPLGQLSRFDSSQYRLYFNVFYLKAIKRDFFNDRSAKKESYYGYVNPLFYTKEGELLVEGNHQYTSAINDEIYFNEFSRREKRKYKKHPERFK